MVVRKPFREFPLQKRRDADASDTGRILCGKKLSVRKGGTARHSPFAHCAEGVFFAKAMSRAKAAKAETAVYGRIWQALIL